MDLLNKKGVQNNVYTQLLDLLQKINLRGQWSLDIMQNGQDFWIIDMAIAATSALADKLPVKLAPVEENWLPRLGND